MATITEYVDNTYMNESTVRRLVAKDLKIVSGTIVIAASSYTSTGESFDYTNYGSRFLWCGLTPRADAAPSGSAGGDEIGYVATYDPVNKKVYVMVCAGDGKKLEGINPLSNHEITLQYTLFVFEGGASAGTGIG